MCDIQITRILFVTKYVTKCLFRRFARNSKLTKKCMNSSLSLLWNSVFRKWNINSVSGLAVKGWPVRGCRHCEHRWQSRCGTFIMHDVDIISSDFILQAIKLDIVLVKFNYSKSYWWTVEKNNPEVAWRSNISGLVKFVLWKWIWWLNWINGPINYFNLLVYFKNITN